MLFSESFEESGEIGFPDRAIGLFGCSGNCRAGEKQAKASAQMSIPAFRRLDRGLSIEVLPNAMFARGVSSAV